MDILLGGVRTHLFRKYPENSCNPSSAKTQIKNVVSARTSDNSLIDFNSALTIVFRPVNKNNIPLGDWTKWKIIRRMKFAAEELYARLLHYC